MRRAAQWTQVKIRIKTADLEKLCQEAPGEMDVIMERVAQRALDMARSRAPVKTGKLRASLRLVKRQRNGRAIWRMEDGVAYGIYVEFGAARRPRQPFFYPAVMAAAAEVTPAFRRYWSRKKKNAQ